MERVLILHRVADFAAWKAVFDGAADIRQEAGERQYEVLQSVEDAQLVVHISTWTSVEAARQFFQSPRLEQIRQRAGVEAPQFFYLQTVELGDLSAS